MSDEHDKEEAENESKPAWVPQSQPQPESDRTVEPPDGGVPADPDGPSEPTSLPDVTPPVDRSATQSFPPLGPVGPPPGQGSTPPSTPKPPVERIETDRPSRPPPPPSQPSSEWVPRSSARPRPPVTPTRPAAQHPPASSPAAPQRPASNPTPASIPSPIPDQSPSGFSGGTKPPAPSPAANQPPARQPGQAGSFNAPPQQYPAPQDPASPAAGGQNPGYRAPAGQNPDYQTPSAQNPGYQAPVGQNPGYQAPVGQNPGYQGPPAQGAAYQGQYQAPGAQSFGNQPLGSGPGAQPQQGYAAPQGPAPGAAPPAKAKRSKLGPVLGFAAVAGLLGGGLAFLATRDSNGDVEAGSATTTTISTDSATESVPEETTTTTAAPLGAEELSHSVVQIQLLLDGQPTCTGSGTIVDTAGTVVTNFHVVEQSPICPHDRIGIAISESSQAIPTLAYEADLLAFDSDLDIAVVRIARDINGVDTTDSFVPIEVGDSDLVGLGDELRVIGYPGIGGETVTFTTGSVSGFAETAEGGERSWLKTDATITGGNSGGLAADEEGRFVGIPTRVGTGSGQIVDCRVIADSNGDGRLDNADSCVPIGGFINGIRPVALAIPLIEEAEFAQPIDQGQPGREEPMSMDVIAQASNPTWTSGIDAAGVAIDRFVAAPAGLPELCLTWDYEDVPTGSLSDAVWLIDGETIPEASIFASPNEGPDSGSFWACINRDGGLLAGTYELAWLVDEEFVFAEGIIVNEGTTAIVEVLNSTELPLCVVQFNPSGTASYGLNELSEVLAPGDSVVVEVGVGSLDARAIDCDGDVRIEDDTGFVISDDLLVTVE